MEIFGSPLDTEDDHYLMWDVGMFFRNGGSKCYIGRVASATADLAAGLVVNSTPATAADVVGSTEGTWANGITVQTVRKTVEVGTLPAAATVTTGAKTSLLLATGISRLRVGDLMRVRSTNIAESDTLTSVVTGVNTTTNTVAFTSAAPTGAIGVASPSDAVVESLLFDVFVRDSSGNLLASYLNLRMSALSANLADTIINGTFRTPITWDTNQSLVVGAFDNRPNNQTVTLAGGLDGIGDIGDSEFIGGGLGTGTGLNLFDANSDFDMLSVCGARGTSEAIVKALLDYAELRKSFIAITNVPKGSSRSTALAYAGTTVNVFTTWAEGYWMPWLKVLDPSTNLSTLIPPTGARQGVLARTHLASGTAKAAGGIEDGKILGILGLETEVQEIDYDVLYPARINCAQSTTGQGISFNGNLTLDPTGEVIESGIRFYLLMTAKAIKNGLAWTKFKFNTAETRARVVRNISSLLREDWRKGQLDGKKESDAYFVICDETNNDAVVRAARKMVVRVGVNVAHAAEFIPVTIELDTRAIDAVLAAIS